MREATTAVGGTASCSAHAVLLAHPEDLPGRRRQRLAELRKLAEVKRETATAQEDVLLELLVHEYSLAAAMDMAPGTGQRSGGQGGHGGQGGQGRQGGEDAHAVPATPMRLWAVTVGIVIGFIIGGVGLILDSYLVMGVGVVTILICGVLSLAWGIMENVH